MLAKFKILFFIFCFSATSFAADFIVKINGTFPGAEAKTIRLMRYGDQITYTHQEIDYAVIDKEGKFSFQFRIHEPEYIFYRIDHARMGHFVEPGNEYTIDFEPVNFDTLDDRRNPYLEPWYFEFELNNKNKSGNLDLTISKFNEMFDDFLIEHFSDVARRRQSKPFEEFRSHTDSLFNVELKENSFFKNYYDYKFALYYRIANIKDPLALFEKYIIDKPVLYKNPQYMNFFNTVFDKYLIAGSRNIRVSDLTISINRHNSYYALMDSLGKDTILRNELLRELVMLNSLKNMYHDHDYRKQNVASIVQYVKNHSKFPQHRNIAANLHNNFTRLANGHPAPTLELINDNGEIVSLDDYNGKFVLLNFWATWCVVCFAEFSVMKDLYEEYSDRFEILSISVDRNVGDFNQYVRKNPLPWDFYHFNYDFRLLDRYDVRRFPLFVLIDPDGNLIDNTAPLPSRGLNRRIARAIYQWDRSKH